MKAFFRELVLIGFLVIGIAFGTQAQQGPGAIKYQAVLRDVNGKTLANKANVNLRISLRLDDPTTGQIAYSEEHMGITTNAYGVINLEIGGGMVTSGKDLHQVPWAQHDIYVQIEIETDGTGYTHMGNAELLAVPYAFYAENASGDKLYENLSDNVLPKYNAANKTLINSGVSQKGRNLEVDASSIIFINTADGNMPGYKFPMTVGRREQVLGFTDNAGTLGWIDVTGGGGGGGVSLNLKGDGQLVYWNNTKGELDTVPALKYDYKAARKLELNTDIIGDNNNVLRSDKLGSGQIWVGNNFSNRLKPVDMKGAVSIDWEGNTKLSLDGDVIMDDNQKTKLNLAMKGGIRRIPGQNGDIDTLAVDNAGSGGGSGASLWEAKPNDKEGYIQLYPKNEVGRTYVGIGYADPKALLHVNGLGSPEDLEKPRALFSDCWVQFSGKIHESNYLPFFFWQPEKASLFVGATEGAVPELGNYSFAFGAEALAVPDHTFALGQKASVAKGATHAFAIGNSSSASQQNAVALGRAAKGYGPNSVALGYNAVASGENAVVLGHNQYAGSNAVLVGYRNGNENGTISEAVFVGRNNQGSGDIVIGSNNISGSGSIVIGTGFETVPENSILVGVGGDAVLGPTMLGHVYMGSNVANLVSVGRVNIIEDQEDGSYPNVFGSWLTNTGDYKSLTMIGDQFSDADRLSLNPKFMYGSGEDEEGGVVYFEIDGDGNAYFREGGQIMTFSDERLKTDIKPMLWTPDLLDLITPVSYSFKSDKQQKTHFGFIAQEVRKVFPELVLEGNKGMLSLDYIGLIPVLWQINQNLSHKIDDLEQRLEEQSRKQAELESELQAIKEKLGM